MMMRARSCPVNNTYKLNFKNPPYPPDIKNETQATWYFYASYAALKKMRELTNSFNIFIFTCLVWSIEARLQSPQTNTSLPALIAQEMKGRLKQQFSLMGNEVIQS